MTGPLETLRVLPVDTGSRFGTVALGFDRVSTIRDEHATLAAVASLLTGTPVDRLSLHDLMTVQGTITTRAAMSEPDRVAAALGAVERVLISDNSNEHRPVLAADAALWILAVGVRR